MRLAFMGTPDFAVPVLEALISAGHGIVQVYTQPPRPAGRGKTLRQSPVHSFAELQSLPVDTPASFRDPTTLAAFAKLGLDAAIVVAYGQILPQAALDAPRLGCLNLHASLLPRWRGAAPIQRAIMAGDAETGVSVMQMEAGLDTGPIWAEARTKIDAEDTAASLHDRLAAIGAPLMTDVLKQLESGGSVPRLQSAEGVTYAAKIEKTEARIDWTRTAKAVDCHIRGLSPFPGAWCEVDGARVKVLLSKVEAGNGPPGQALDEKLLIGCGEGAIRLVGLQKAGRSVADAADFLNGTAVPTGSVLT